MNSGFNSICLRGALALAFYLVTLAAAPLIHGQDGFWVPVDPPKCHYEIDARMDLESGVIEGKQTVTLKNNAHAPIRIVAFHWSIGTASSIRVQANGKLLELIEGEEGTSVSPPLFYRLSKPLEPGSQVNFEVTFKKDTEFSSKSSSLGTVRWYPRLWWGSLPVHDSFSVKLDIPEGYALAASGRLNKETGRYENEGAKTFGIHLGKNQKAESREVDGILITALFTEKGAECARVCLETAVDVVKFYKEWLGFYPFNFLYIIPGGKGPWGGYPFATGIVVIHGQETFKDGESLLHWKHITAHEIGHEYWGEWVLDPDNPDWLWIAMGIFADTEYTITKKIDPERRIKWMGNYTYGTSVYYDTTVDIPPARLSKIEYGYNNTIVHSKCYAIISALDSLLGRKEFERIYKKCLRDYGGKRLGWNEFQRYCEKESGQSLEWFFEQWVRTNRYLCYKIESKECKPEGDGFLSKVRVKRLGTMKMPVQVQAVFEDGIEQVQHTLRTPEMNVLTFRSATRLVEVTLDPERKLAMLEEPLEEISEKAAEAVARGWSKKDSLDVYETIKDEAISSGGLWYRVGMYLYAGDKFPQAYDCFEKVLGCKTSEVTQFAAHGWLGLLKDLSGERKKAILHYKEALERDTGEHMGHSWLKIQMDREWLEERLTKPFTAEGSVKIPGDATADDLIEILGELNWKGEGRTPYLIFEKAKKLTIEESRFWLKLGLLLFDSGYIDQSFIAIERLSRMDTTKLQKFTAYTWMGHLKDLKDEREVALGYYRRALEYDSGLSMQHGQFNMIIDRKWVEIRLQTPFTW